jgi:MYXO-CTERM domain-containing protein
MNSASVSLCVAIPCAAVCWAVAGPASAHTVEHEQEQGAQCTVAYVMGNAIDDDRPLIWRNYDWNDCPHPSQVLHHQTNDDLDAWGPYDWIATSQESWFVFGGLNEMGVGCFNTLIVDFNEEGGYDFGNYRIQAWILANATSVADVRTAIDEQIKFWAGDLGGVDHDWSYPSGGGGFYPAMTLVVADAEGNTSLFEIARDFYHEYDPQDPARLGQFPVQVGVRANKPHRRDDHLDNEGGAWADTGGRRYVEALQNVQAMAENGDGVTVEEIMNVVSRHGEPGFEPHDYGPLPEDEHGEYQNSNWKNQDGSIIWAAAPDEDPLTATFFIAMGPPAYSCYLPMWVASWESLPGRLSETNDQSIVHYVWRIFDQRVDEGYDQYIHSLFENMERNNREAAELARTYWNELGFDAATATAITTEAAENVYLAAKNMDEGSGYDLNEPPRISDIDVTWTDQTATLACTATDDSAIDTHEWAFGDGSTGQGATVDHDYAALGKYLVRCRVTDDAGVRNSRWSLIEVGTDDGGTGTGTGDGGTDDGGTDTGDGGDGGDDGSGNDDGGDGGGDGGTDGGTSGGSADDEDSGCGCRGSNQAPGAGLMALVLAGVLTRRRRA